MDDVVAAVTDLFFQSRVAAAARIAGRKVVFVTRPEQLVREQPFRLGLVDLDADLDVIAAILALRPSAQGPMVAFGPHLDTEKRKAARAAGADRVLAKSKFVTELPHLMNNDTPDQTTAAAEANQLLTELRGYGQRMEQLGRYLQDSSVVQRLYFGPQTHMELKEGEKPLVLDEADYLDFLAIEPLKHMLERLHNVQAGAGDTILG